MNLHSFSSITDCTIEYSMSKLSENSPFQVSNNNHDDRNNYQIICTVMENARKSMKKTDMMEYDEITFIFITNGLYN